MEASGERSGFDKKKEEMQLSNWHVRPRIQDEEGKKRQVKGEWEQACGS